MTSIMSAENWTTSPPKRLLIIKPSALGDVVQALPLAIAAKEKWPDLKLGWVIVSGLKGLLEQVPAIDEVYEFQRGGGFGPFRSLCQKLRAANFDTVVDLQGLLRTGIMSLATQAERKIGIQTAREGASLAYTHVIDGTSRMTPAHARYWKLAQDWGRAERPASSALFPGSDLLDAMQKIVAHLPRPWIGLQPGTRWVTKTWPAQKFARTGKQLAKEFGGSLILLGAPDEASLTQECLQEICQDSSIPVIDLAGKSNLKQLSALLSQLDVLICNDSGPMHLAADLQVPVVAIFTCTDSIQSGPPGKLHELVMTGVPCRACYHKHCPKQGEAHMACLEDVSTEHVAMAARRVLDRKFS